MPKVVEVTQSITSVITGTEWNVHVVDDEEEYETYYEVNIIRVDGLVASVTVSDDLFDPLVVPQIHMVTHGSEWWSPDKSLEDMRLAKLAALYHAEIKRQPLPSREQILDRILDDVTDAVIEKVSYIIDRMDEQMEYHSAAIGQSVYEKILGGPLVEEMEAKQEAEALHFNPHSIYERIRNPRIGLISDIQNEEDS
jgi:hypothetical protein